jgi:hypothetical protein
MSRNTIIVMNIYADTGSTVPYAIRAGTEHHWLSKIWHSDMETNGSP